MDFVWMVIQTVTLFAGVGLMAWGIRVLLRKR